jgi:hypothetical protein
VAGFAKDRKAGRKIIKKFCGGDGKTGRREGEFLTDFSS